MVRGYAHRTCGVETTPWPISQPVYSCLYSKSSARASRCTVNCVKFPFAILLPVVYLTVQSSPLQSSGPLCVEFRARSNFLRISQDSCTQATHTFWSQPTAYSKLVVCMAISNQLDVCIRQLTSLVSFDSKHCSKRVYSPGSATNTVVITYYNHTSETIVRISAQLSCCQKKLFVNDLVTLIESLQEGWQLRSVWHSAAQCNVAMCVTCSLCSMPCTLYLVGIVVVQTN